MNTDRKKAWSTKLTMWGSPRPSSPEAARLEERDAQVEAGDESDEAVANGDEQDEPETAVDQHDQLADEGVLILPRFELVQNTAGLSFEP